MTEHLLTASASPHVRGKQTTRSIMTDVLIALLPASVLAVVFFGIQSLILIFAGVVSAVLAEFVTQKFMKKTVTITDMSAAVTGLLLALNMPIHAKWWVVSIGAIFAIVVVKQIFGGLGNNFVNPALAARIILIASWPQHMTGTAFLPVDAVSTATPLSIISEGSAEALPTLMQMFVGGPNVYGCIGEVSALALLIGGAYLIFRKVMSYRIPVVYLGTVAVFSLLAGKGFDGTLFQLCAGGLMIGAIFMATDYVTSPSTPVGQIIYAVGCGVITCVIRFYGGYPEGVSFAIIFMNLLTPLIEKYVRTTKYGLVKKPKKSEVE